MPVSAGPAASVVAVLVEEPSTALCALRNTISIDISVDLNAADITLELVPVLDGPANNVDIDSLVWETFKSGEYADPLVVLFPESVLDLGALRGSHPSITLPAHAVVDLALAGNDLVVAVVPEAERIAVGLNLVLPDLVKSSPEIGRRVPGPLVQVALRGSGVPGVGVVEGEGLGVKGTHRSSVATVDVRLHITGDSAREGTGDEGGDSECRLHLKRV